MIDKQPFGRESSQIELGGDNPGAMQIQLTASGQAANDYEALQLAKANMILSPFKANAHMTFNVASPTGH